MILLHLARQDNLDEDESVIRCSVLHASLDENPTFEAISYRWRGEPVTILLNDTPFKICSNLVCALRFMRIERCRTLWADAICINQTDNVEKSWQVGLMGRIYKQAQRSLLWLGPEQDDSDLAMDVLTKWSNKDNEATRYAGFFEELEEKQSSSFSEFSLRVFHSLSSFFNRDYWSRIWIIQEVVLCKEFLLLCGDKTIGIMDFYISLIIMTSSIGAWYLRMDRSSSIGEVQENMQSPERITSILANVPLFWVKQHYFHGPDTMSPLRLSLYYFLRVTCVPVKFRGFATDDRDRIFAILELSRDAQRLGIIPNYELSTEDLYINVARALLLRGRQFCVLSLCQENKKYSRLPSWTPDWSSLVDHELTWPHMGDVMERCPCYDDFTPSKGLDLGDFPVQPKDQRRLRLHAMMVDFVESTGKSYSQIAAQVITDREPNRVPCAPRSWVLELLSLQRKHRQKLIRDSV